MVLDSRSEEKVAKIFPKIIQAVKKQMFCFPILLMCFFEMLLDAGGAVVDPAVVGQVRKWCEAGAEEWSCLWSVTVAATGHLYWWLILIFKYDWLEVRGRRLMFTPALSERGAGEQIIHIPLQKSWLHGRVFYLRGDNRVRYELPFKTMDF